MSIKISPLPILKFNHAPDVFDFVYHKAVSVQASCRVRLSISFIGK